MASFATPAQMFERHDVRLINDLANDDNARQSRIELLTNANVLTALADASGAIESALLVSGRYSTDDLEGLTGNSANLLERMTADIAMYYIYDRKPSLRPEEMDRYREVTNQHLEALRKGVNIFNLADAVTAGKPTIDGPTSVDYQRLNLIPDRTQRYYPNRAGRLPTNRG